MKLLVLAITLLGTTSALADPNKAILGKWIDEETGSTVEYKERGKVEQTLPSGDVLRGKYAFFDETHIYIEFESDLLPVSPVLTPISIAGDDLQMVGEDGKKVKKFKRKKDKDEPKDKP